jgi:signal transduction histidine kinase
LSGLSGKLIVFTAMIVIGTCSALGWYFIHAQIEVMTTELLRSGTLLASNLATTMRYSVIAADMPRLEQLIQGVLTNDQVAYAIVRSKNGQLLTASGKEGWHSVFQRGETAVLPEETLMSFMDPDTFHSPRVHVVQLLRGKPIVIPGTISEVGMLATLFSPSSEGFIYHLAVPIKGNTFPIDEQSILDLMFGEYQEQTESGSPVSDSVYGLVELGLTTGHTQDMLHHLILQMLAMTLSIIAVGLVVVIILARRITTPIKALQTMATQVASGNLNVALPPSSFDEIGDLTRHFNSMTAALKDHEQWLQEMNRTLEVRVCARTQELEHANLQLKDLDRLKTSLLSSASHELRTPLMSMTVHVENLLDGVKGSLAGDQIDILQRVRTNLQRLRRMIDDLLNVALLQTGNSPLQSQAVVLQHVIEGAWNDLHHIATAKRIALTNKVPQILPPVLGDPDKLGQIFTNLIHNAIKFNAFGGRILITGQETDSDRVEVCVEDSGCGISASELENIFLPFYRSPSVGVVTRGSGLGLAIVKHLVGLHHGSITVQSTPGQGTRFFVTLPRVPPTN